MGYGYMSMNIDKAMNAMIGGNYELRHLLFGSLIRAALLEGVCYVVTEKKNSDDFRSVALWYGPGHSLFDRSAKVTMYQRNVSHSY